MRRAVALLKAGERGEKVMANVSYGVPFMGFGPRMAMKGKYD
jgi:hypothetical protein